MPVRCAGFGVALSVSFVFVLPAIMPPFFQAPKGRHSPDKGAVTQDSGDLVTSAIL